MEEGQGGGGEGRTTITRKDLLGEHAHHAPVLPPAACSCRGLRHVTAHALHPRLTRGGGPVRRPANVMCVRIFRSNKPPYRRLSTDTQS